MSKAVAVIGALDTKGQDFAFVKAEIARRGHTATEGIVGFFGASSIERLPTEPAIEGQARKFKELKP